MVRRLWFALRRLCYFVLANVNHGRRGSYTRPRPNPRDVSQKAAGGHVRVLSREFGLKSLAMLGVQCVESYHMDTSKLCTDFGSRVLYFANRDPKSVATFQLLVFHETMRANAFQRPTQLLKGLYK